MVCYHAREHQGAAGEGGEGATGEDCGVPREGGGVVVNEKAGGLEAPRLAGDWWGPESNYFMAQQVAGFGTSAEHLWVATVCLALPSPTRTSLVSQAVQVCFATF